MFGWPAIHTRIGKESETQPKVENVCIDCGVRSKKESRRPGHSCGGGCYLPGWF
ncbi:hypothetical protein KRR40_24245 [Niabella defluvii]|nr:hypothetical protein KRR40_24245 [Niabella sp. I65]